MSGLPQGSASGSPNDCLRIGAFGLVAVETFGSEGWRCGGGGVGSCGSCGGGDGSRAFVDWGSVTVGMGRSGMASMVFV
jgi:hypothetical protein